ncbi:hypothetical protein HK105_205045 [Polyrhizophydium stewartii]|uniref:Uncharacterized protein n=1 Tax=Polyrhizophydium stewartii TaxID=2732419 RepID=A0ABR4N7E7_9FUNG|nr:hypothetical protein HK105_003671 [Polyrhizophydium stewartii]
MAENHEEPLTCSMWAAADNLQLCYTALPQLKNYYRYGKWKDCTPLREELFFCWSLRSMPAAAAQAAMRARAEAKDHAKFKQRPSLDVWELRTEPPPNFPPRV